MELTDLYREVILDHNRHPRNFGRLEPHDAHADGHNPLCGDRLSITLRRDGDMLEDLRFEGQGCAISVASASMMTEAVTGTSVAEALDLAAAFRGMMAGEVEPEEDRFGDLVALKGVVKYPIRIKCAVLAWDVLQEALSGDGEAGATHDH